MVNTELRDEDERSPRMAFLEHSRIWFYGTAMYTIRPITRIKLYNSVASMMSMAIPLWMDDYEFIEVDVQFLLRRGGEWIQLGEASLIDASRASER